MQLAIEHPEFLTADQLESAVADAWSEVIDGDGGVIRPEAEFGDNDRDGFGPKSSISAVRLKELAIPPAWTDVVVAKDPSSKIQVIGTDEKGRRQYRYSKTHTARAASQKFARLKEVTRALPKIKAKIATYLNGKDGPDKEAAAVLHLIHKTGFRIGSDRDTDADVPAVGASTLQAKHVQVSGDKLSFNFSVTGDTPVCVSFGDSPPQMMPIADAVAEYDRAQSGRVLGMDHACQTVMASIGGTLKHDEEVLEIEFEGSKKPLRMTRGHSVFIVRDGLIQCIPAGEIVVGDYLAAMSSWNSRPANKVTLRCPVVPPSRNAKTFGEHYEIELDTELSWLLGLYCAEGHTTKYSIVWSLHSGEVEIQRRIATVVKKLWNKDIHVSKNSGNGVQVSLFCGSLSPFFTNQCGTGALKKHVPAFLWMADKEVVLSFLGGYLQGDGHWRSHDIVAKTVSVQLHHELSWIAHALGISVSAWSEPAHEHVFSEKCGGHVSQASEAFVLSFSKLSLTGQQTKKFAPVPTIHCVPTDGLCQMWRMLQWRPKRKHSEQHLGNRLQNKRIGKKHVQQFLEWLTSVDGSIPTAVSDMAVRYLVLSNSEIGTRMVTGVRVGGIETVYDFTVPGTESFFGGVVPVLLHNTGKKGVKQKHSITDKTLADFLRPRVAQGGRLFNTTDGEVRALLKRISPVLKVKDLRMAVGTETALKAIKNAPPAKSEDDKEELKKKVAKKVAKKLGNTPEIAIKSYVPPQVFDMGDTVAPDIADFVEQVSYPETVWDAYANAAFAHEIGNTGVVLTDLEFRLKDMAPGELKTLTSDNVAVVRYAPYRYDLLHGLPLADALLPPGHEVYFTDAAIGEQLTDALPKLFHLLPGKMWVSSHRSALTLKRFSKNWYIQHNFNTGEFSLTPTTPSPDLRQLDDTPACAITVVTRANPLTGVSEVLLVKRSSKPGNACPGMWAIPGGMVEQGEQPQAAALRELAEETGLTEVGVNYLGVYHKGSIDVHVFWTNVTPETPHDGFRPGDDATSLSWTPVYTLHRHRLAWDHADIISEVMRRQGQPVLFDTCPSIVCSVAVFRKEGPTIEVLLGQRSAESKFGFWALPGGHMKPDDGDPFVTARRELFEETGLDQFGVGLIPIVRGRPCPHRPGVLEYVFGAILPAGIEPRPGSDAHTLMWSSVGNLPDMAFDHEAITLAALTKVFSVSDFTPAVFANDLTGDQRRTISDMVIGKEPTPDTGLLIVVEGIDGSGKSSLVDPMVAWLRKLGYNVVTTKWNSSRLLSSTINRGKDQRVLTPMLYSLLHAADMVLRYQEIVVPALQANKIVVADRYYYTSIVRDGVRGVDAGVDVSVFQHFRQPDLILHCVVTPEQAAQRLDDDHRLNHYGTGMDLQLASNPKKSYIKYARKMDRRYRKLLSGEPNYHRLDCTQPSEKCLAQVQELIKDTFHIGRYATAKASFAFCPTGEGGGVDPSCRPSYQQPRDSMGRLGPHGEASTQEFKKWFSGSKVTTPDGIPLAVYHGTKDNFDKFDLSKHELSPRGDSGALGIFFTPDSSGAGHYANGGGRVITAYLNIQNPHYTTEKEYRQATNSRADAKKMRERLIGDGYDGMYVDHLNEWIAFQPEQVRQVSAR